MLLPTLSEEIKEAMRAKDTLRLETLRGIKAAFTNELVATKRTPRDTLSDDEMIAVIARLAKQRKDAAEQFENGGRPELAEKENKELAILETFLPRMMSREEIKKLARAKKDELQIQNKSKMGMLMGALMKDLKGKADGTMVKKAVEELF